MFCFGRLNRRRFALALPLGWLFGASALTKEFDGGILAPICRPLERGPPLVIPSIDFRFPCQEHRHHVRTPLLCRQMKRPGTILRFAFNIRPFFEQKLHDVRAATRCRQMERGKPGVIGQIEDMRVLGQFFSDMFHIPCFGVTVDRAKGTVLGGENAALAKNCDCRGDDKRSIQNTGDGFHNVGSALFICQQHPFV